MKPLFALIIEDEQALANVFATAFQQANFETEIIRDGTTAIERLDAVIPDVIVLDLHLPFVSGETILTQVRSDPRLSETRVVVSTADQAFAEMLQDQVDEVFIKPVSFSEFLYKAEQLYSSITQPID